MQTSAKSDPNTLSNAVSFCCSKCGAPLKLDPSLQTLPDKGFLQEISAPLYSGNQLRQRERHIDVGDVQYTTNYIKHSLTTQSGGGAGGESDFTLVGNVPQQSGGAGITQVIRINNKMFDILSGQAEIDHPLCEDCTDMLLDQLDQQLRITEEECRGYKEFLEQLESREESQTEEDYDKTLKQLEAEEEELRQKIESLDLECKKLDSELLAENGKQNDLREEEQDFLKEYNELKRQVVTLEDEDRSSENQLKYAEMQLDRLIKVNAFNATFHIWHNGHFGTINGFRLGRLPNVPVDWNEINTAWGQTCLLLHSLARKMDLKFQRYRLVPYGSHSYIEALSDRTKELPLYCTGGYRFFWDKKFDSAMVAFLDCLQQFKEQVERGDSQFCLPYRMSSGKIEDTSTGSSYSIKVQFNSEEQWTKALKFMLTNLRWGLAWVSSQCSNND